MYFVYITFGTYNTVVRKVNNVILRLYQWRQWRDTNLPVAARRTDGMAAWRTDVRVRRGCTLTSATSTWSSWGTGSQTARATTVTSPGSRHTVRRAGAPGRGICWGRPDVPSRGRPYPGSAAPWRRTSGAGGPFPGPYPRERHQCSTYLYNTQNPVL